MDTIALSAFVDILVGISYNLTGKLGFASTSNSNKIQLQVLSSGFFVDYRFYFPNRLYCSRQHILNLFLTKNFTDYHEVS